MTTVDFFCTTCRIDQTRPAIRKGWNGRIRYEWWEALCENCENPVRRRITERNGDPYLWQSIKLRQERDRYKIDLIQKNDSKFKQYYKKQWDEDQAKEERTENSWKESKRSRDKYLKDMNTNYHTKKFAREVIKKGEKLSNEPYGGTNTNAT